jgi:hypothetical protein
MASAMDKFWASWKQSLTIGGIAAAAVYIGFDRVVAQGASTVGLFGILGRDLGSAAVVGGVVFLSEMAYTLALK